MIGANLYMMLGGFLKLTLLAGAALYIGLVCMAYLADGPGVRPRFEFADPARSAERLAVWMGVKVLLLVMRVGSPLFGMLSEASADVGEWFLSRRHQTR